MSRLFILTLTLIVLIALASAGWLTLGAIAGEEDTVQAFSDAAVVVSGDRVFHKDASEVESSDLFIAEATENQEQATFDDFAPSAVHESNEFAEMDPFTPHEQTENPFTADPTAGHDELRVEHFQGPQNRRRKPSSVGSPRIRSDKTADLDQPTRNALKEMVNQIEREADELQQLGRLKEAEHRRHVYRELKARMERRKNRDRHFPPGFDVVDQLIEVRERSRNPSHLTTVEERETQRKIELLQRAIKNVKQAGLEQQAQELSLQIHRMREELEHRRNEREIMERERRQQRERKHVDNAPRDNIHEALNDLRHEIRNLRNEVREMHEMLEQHVKHRGKNEVELNPRNFEIEVEDFKPAGVNPQTPDPDIEIDLKARDQDKFEAENEERRNFEPDNQSEQIEEEGEDLPSEDDLLPATETKIHSI